MKHLLPLVILTNCLVIQGVLEWTVIGKVTDYGQNVTLFCNVSNCCPKDAGWDMWTPEQRTLYIDVKTGRSNKKYDGKIMKDGYTLVIQNLTEQDLNVSYSCLYDVTLGTQKFLLEEDVFTYISTTQPNDSTGNSTVLEGQIAGIIVGIAVAGVAVCLFVFLLRKQKTYNNNGNTDANTALVEDKSSTKKAFLSPLENKMIIEGEKISFECEAGMPYPVEWFKDDVLLIHSTRLKIDTLDSNVHKLTIPKTRPDDKGKYSIKMNDVSISADLDVKAFFKRPLENKLIIEGEEISFECEAEMPYRAQWFKDDDLLIPSTRLKIESLDSNVHKLTILKTKPGDKGKYSIKMKDISSSADLDVEVLPEAINRLKTEDRIKYMQLLQSSETEKRYFIRIMIVGKQTVGKTCLLKRLLMEDIDGVTSTDGVDIVVRRCKIDIKDGKWIIGKELSDDRVDRIQRAFHQRKPTKIEKSDKKERTKQQASRKNDPTEAIENPNSESDSNKNSNYNTSNNSSTIVSEIKPSTNANATGKINMIGHDNASTSRNDTADNTKIFDNIDMMDKKFAGNVKDNENITNTETMNNLKDKDLKKNSLVMPQDLMSSVFTKSPSNINPNRYALCGLWDFAGQKEFYATHQAFLTNNAIYLVVVDMTEDISNSNDGIKKKIFADFQNIGEYIDFWFDSIHCQGTVEAPLNKAFNTDIDPPVFIVFTRKDEYEKENLGKEVFEERKEELKKQIDLLLGKQSKYHHLRKIHWLSNVTDPIENFKKLQQDISEAARKMENWGKHMPLKWILLEHLIAINKEDGKDFINFSDILRLAKHHNINIQDSGEVLIFLRFQHEEGNIIFFEDMKDFIILNPKWLVDAFRCLVSNKIDDTNQHCTDSTDFRQNGIISIWLITERFKSKLESNFLEQKESLLEVMKKFDILLKIGDTDKYIMPSMMQSISPNEIWQKFGIRNDNCKRTSWLCLKFSFLPPAFFNHFTLWFIRKYQVENEKSLQLFRGIGLFNIDESQCEKLLVVMSGDTIALQLVSFSTREKEFGSMCANIYKDLGQETEAIKQRYKLKISYELHFKCDTERYSEDTMLYQRLKKIPEYYCTEHKKSHQTEEILLPWMMNANDEEHIEQDERNSKITEALFKRKLEDKTILEGAKVIFECEAENPYPVNWYKDGNEISPSSNIKIEALQSRVHRLTIIQTTLEDKGKYEIKIKDTLSGAILDINEMPVVVKEMSVHDRNVFLQAAHTGTVVRYNIKVMIVGQSGVGKTCLLRRLMNEQIHDVGRTDGINIVKQCKINLQTQKWIFTSDEDFSKTVYQNEEFADCGFWDFAGQKEFYATHQTFFSTNAIYLLVVDISKDFAGKTYKDMIEDEFYKVGEYIEFWLDSIHCYMLPDKDSVLNSALPDTDVVLNPPVIIIGTGIDKIEEEEDRCKAKKRFLSTLSGLDKRRHIRKSYFLSNTEPEKYTTEFEDLRKTIFEVAKYIPKWGENLPTRWIVLENEMDRYIAEEKELVISYEVAKQLAIMSSFPNSEIESELDSFLKYEHEIGNLIFFDDIKSYIVLEPKWLVDIFKCFVSPFQFQEHFVEMAEWSKLESTGILRDSLIKKLFKKVPGFDSVKHTQFALQVMEKFDIIVKPTTLQGNEEYYIPCMMKASDFETITKIFNVQTKNCSRTSWFCLDFNFLPPSFFNHLLVTLVKEYVLCTDQDDRGQLYRSIGIFNLEKSGCKKLVACLSENAIAVQVWEYHYKEQHTCNTNYSNIREYLISTVNLLQRRYKMNIQYACFFKCPEGKYYKMAGKVSCDETIGKYFCSEHQSTHSLEDLRKNWW